jgi:hypothetical protein
MISNLPDVVTIAEGVGGGYGDSKIRILGQVDALFLQSFSRSHAANVDVNDADAHVYLDTENEIVKSRAYRLEGMYINANPFGGVDNNSWYKVTRVPVGQRKLLDNDVDNVHCFLKATAKKEIVE